MTAGSEQAQWETTSPEATFALGEALGRSLIGGITIGLVGPLGAGKTQLVKGIAAGNAIDDTRRVTSPTFTLVHEYGGRLCLYHLDAYRVSGPKEFLSLGFDEFVRRDSAVVVEWADRVRPIMPDEALCHSLSDGVTDRLSLTRLIRRSIVPGAVPHPRTPVLAAKPLVLTSRA